MGVLAAPISVFIFGSYLSFASIMGRHMDEAFSSLRIEHFKNFLRMHIDSSGTLHLYAIGIDRIPRQWREDDMFRRDAKKVPAPAHCSSPSRWRPLDGSKCTLVDY